MVAPLVVSLTVVHSLLYPGAQYDTPLLGPVAIKSEGLHFALQQSLRISAFALAGLTAIDEVPAIAWVTAFGNGGFGRRLGLMIVGSLVLLSGIRLRIQTIELAQRSRGFRPSGLIGRTLGLTALAGPLATSMLIEAEQRAVTLVVKGFLDEPTGNVSGPKSAWWLLVAALVLGMAGAAINLAL